MMNPQNALLALLAFLLFASCSGPANKEQKVSSPYNDINYYYGDAERDSLLVDLVTYIGRKPAQATATTRFEPQFREYYINMAKNFTLYFYNIDGEVHTFYLSRPARSLDGNRRGVLGTFKRDAAGKITGFREVLNTVIADEERIRQLGEQIMSAFLLNQQFDDLLLNRNIVEWPDSLLKYDTAVFEWRYVPLDLQ
ncbi:MAG: hypothetical protein LWX09_08775 [Bacteroidia bacterium]|nr:hypothetical protein [Bacteroidia bacterium]